MTNQQIHPVAKRGKHRDEDWMRKQIQEKNRTLTDITDELPVQKTTVRSWRDKFKIQRPLESKEVLEEEISNGNGLKEMAEKWNVEMYEVRIALEKHNII